MQSYGIIGVTLWIICGVSTGKPPPKNILQCCIYVLSDHYDFDKDTDRLTLQLCEVYDMLRSFLLALLCGCILRYTPEGPPR